MNDDPDEAALIGAAMRGETAAFSHLYDRHVEVVIRRLSHLSGPSGNVDDLVQETFLRAMKALPRFRGESPFRHWLLRIAASVAHDDQRRTKRSLWRLFLKPEQLDEAVSPARNAEAYADLAAVHRALGRLSPRLREVIVLFELEGQPLSEIAAELRVSIHTVGSRLRRGRAQLRQLLAQSGYSDLTHPASLLCLKERA
jgi:RNA polymerase sigma factor (sigma-70 family)